MKEGKSNDDDTLNIEENSKLEHLNRALIQSNDKDIIRLEEKLNLIKTLHRLEESRRKHLHYAAIVKEGKNKLSDRIFHNRRSDPAIPMKPLQSLPEGNDKVNKYVFFYDVNLKLFISLNFHIITACGCTYTFD